MDIYEFVSNRLNLDLKYDKSRLYYAKLSSIFLNHDFDNVFLIPVSLYNEIKLLIENNFKDESKTKRNTKLEVSLYLTIIIYNNIFKDDTSEKRCFSTGVQISKEIFSSVISNSYLYEIKNFLIDNNIIYELEYENLNKKYSTKNKLAIKYCINLKYNDNKCIFIKNKYALKFISLLKNGLLYGTKKHSVNNLYLPFSNNEKNIQYLYQKNMYFDEKQFNECLLKKSKDLDAVSRKKLLNCFYSLNSHVFKSSESYGRIYMPFQYLRSDFRQCIRIGNDEEIIEAYDIKCCFVFLSAKLFLSRNYSNELNTECEKIIKLCDKDIYSEILKYNQMPNRKEARKNIKLNVMKWLFSNRRDRHVFINSITEVNLIDKYFKDKFPLFYQNVVFYNERTIYKDIDGKIVKKVKSNLSYECFEFESSIIFETILPFLHEKYKDIPFISLHDGIFIPKKFEAFSNDIKNDIHHLI